MKYANLNDEYLTAISNKGTLKRAYKDLDELKNNINCTQNDTENLIEFDDIKVTIKEAIPDSTCSCPARTVCKHIIISLLYLNEILGVSNQEINEIEFDDSEIKALDKHLLFKTATTLYQKKFLLDINQNSIPEISKTTVITTSFDDVTVKLLNPLDYSVCSCKSTSLCKHKALACLYYLFSIGEIDKEYFKVDDKINKKKYLQMQEYITEIQSLIENILYVGLARGCSDNLEQIAQQVIYCYNYKLYNLSENLNEICNLFNDFLNNKNTFKESILLNKLAKTYFLTIQIQKVKNYSDYVTYVGVLKENFNDSKDLTFIPLGKKDFNNNNVGSTYYFLEKNENLIYSYTQSKSLNLDEYNLYSLDEYSKIWGTSLSKILDYEFELKQPKINSKREITNSNQTSLKRITNLQGKIPLPESAITTNYQKLVKLNYEYENNTIAIIKIIALIKGEYNSVNQSFNMEIIDENAFSIYIETTDKNAIDLLEKYCKNPSENTVFIGKIYLQSGKLKLDPIEFVREGNY